MPDPVRLPVRDREIDPLVAELVEAYRQQGAAADRRHQDLLDSLRARDEEAAARELRRDDQAAAVLASVGDLATQVSTLSTNVGALTTEVRTLTARVPDRPLLWAGGLFVGLLVLTLLGLYAQSRGDDAGDAIDDARRGLAVVAPDDGEL
jgi:hypothetical protein